MAVQLEKEEIRNILLDSWDIIINGVAKERKKMLKWRGKKWDIESRTKIKSLNEGLRQFTDAESAVVHFVKYAEYFLPRSDLNQTLEQLLLKIQRIRDSTDDMEKNREQIKYLIGYAAWSLDGLCNVFTISDNNKLDTRTEVKRMLTTELKVVGAENKIDSILEPIMKWYEESKPRGDKNVR
jgi:hypothetical protein